MARALTDAEVIAHYGDPAPYILPTGRPSLAWEQKILTTITLPGPLPLTWGGKAVHTEVHHLVAMSLLEVLTEIHDQPEVWATINDYGGCYMWRAQRGTKVLSRHAWAIAVDLDTKDNPFRETESHMHPEIVRLFELHGWVWGGRWRTSRCDPQHFEIGF